MKAYVLVKTSAGETASAVQMLRKLPEVKTADVTFGPFDAVLVVETADLTGLSKLVTLSVRSTPGVQETLTCMVAEGV
ncbi:MAG TPA: Lrp/AsnC family transcriptional regulator [Anaerolineae bacterium]|nr:Lrp/AsnC family transcriptional regulator [Anaerolineae bacterium]HIQ06267.1 Lrp/AsnC family transcriptional regulator [Anaerolineae bacterium]